MYITLVCGLDGIRKGLSRVLKYVLRVDYDGIGFGKCDLCIGNIEFIY